MSSVADSASDLRVNVLLSEQRAEVVTSAVGMAVMLYVLVFIGYTFRGLVEPTLIASWLAIMAAIYLTWAIGILAFLWRRPSPTEAMAFWSPLGRGVQMALSFGIAASVWILLPVADAALRSLMIVLYVWFSALLILASTGATRVSSVAILGVLGSVIAVTLIDAVPYATELSVFLAMIAATLLGVRDLVRRAVVRAVEARLMSERAAEALAAALATVAAERDAKTRFIAAASHDLQQPLHAASLFFDRVVDASDPAQRRLAVARARSAFRATANLLEQMLDHLRLEAGAVRARLRPVDVDELVAETVAGHRDAANAAGMRLIIVPSRMAVHADPELLVRALDNLLANAVRHARGERILVGARRRGTALRIGVVDDGEGIRRADLPTLFDDFAQGSGPDKACGGFGLGLASVRRLMTLMGGSVDLDACYRGGSAFYLELPAATLAMPICKAA